MGTDGPRTTGNAAVPTDAAWVAEAVPEGLFALDAGLRVTYHNAVFARLVGRAGEDLRGEPCARVFGCGDAATDGAAGAGRCAVGCLLRRRLESASPALLEEFPLGPAARPHRTRTQVCVRRVEPGGARADGASIVGLVRDPVLAEAANRRQSEFLDVIGHELRTPIVSIQGYSDLILGEKMGAVTFQQKKGLGIVLRNVHRLLGLIQNMTCHAKIALGTLKVRSRPFPLQRAIQRATDPLAGEFTHRGLALDVRCPAAAVVLSGDEDLIVQVLRNLLTNALRASPYGGRVAVGVEAAPGTEAMDVRVDDGGCGLPAPTRDGLPAGGSNGDGPVPCAAADAAAQGAGLGLAIVRGILELHGTELELESRPGEGTRARFRLPLAHEPLPATAEQHWRFAAARPPETERRTILVVDDEEDVLATVTETLKSGGYSVLPAANGEQGLSVAEHNRLDLALLDIEMRGMDGIEVCRRLKEREGGHLLPVYMMTAAASREARVRSFQAGAEGFLDKPFEGRVLLEAVGRAVNRGAAQKVPAIE